jgi:hypothetical protein
VAEDIKPACGQLGLLICKDAASRVDAILVVAVLKDGEDAMSQSELVCRNVDTVASCGAQSTHLTSQASAGYGEAANGGFLKGKRRGTLLWGISGGTILSALGFIGLALFEQYNSSLTELRGDLKHFNEISSEFAKKDTVQRYWEQLKDVYKEMQTANAARAQLECELKASERSREEMARELQRMRERLAYVEGHQAAVTSLNPPAPGKE